MLYSKLSMTDRIARNTKGGTSAFTLGFSFLVIIVLAVFSIVYYWRDTAIILSRHFDRKTMETLRAVYKYNGAIFTQEGPDGLLVGEIPSEIHRNRLMNMQPFLGCTQKVRCSNWRSPTSGDLNVHLPLLNSHTVSGHGERLYRAATGESGRCVSRLTYLFGGHDIGPAEIEIFCFDPSSGAFMYEMLL